MSDKNIRVDFNKRVNLLPGYPNSIWGNKGEEVSSPPTNYEKVTAEGALPAGTSTAVKLLEAVHNRTLGERETGVGAIMMNEGSLDSLEGNLTSALVTIAKTPPTLGQANRVKALNEVLAGVRKIDWTKDPEGKAAFISTAVANLPKNGWNADKALQMQANQQIIDNETLVQKVSDFSNEALKAADQVLNNISPNLVQLVGTASSTAGEAAGVGVQNFRNSYKGSFDYNDGKAHDDYNVPKRFIYGNKNPSSPNEIAYVYAQDGKHYYGTKNSQTEKRTSVELDDKQFEKVLGAFAQYSVLVPDQFEDVNTDYSKLPTPVRNDLAAKYNTLELEVQKAIDSGYTQQSQGEGQGSGVAGRLITNATDAEKEVIQAKGLEIAEKLEQVRVAQGLSNFFDEKTDAPQLEEAKAEVANSVTELADMIDKKFKATDTKSLRDYAEKGDFTIQNFAVAFNALESSTKELAENTTRDADEAIKKPTKKTAASQPDKATDTNLTAEQVEDFKKMLADITDGDANGRNDVVLSKLGVDIKDGQFVYTDTSFKAVQEFLKVSKDSFTVAERDAILEEIKGNISSGADRSFDISAEAEKQLLSQLKAVDPKAVATIKDASENSRAG